MCRDMYMAVYSQRTVRVACWSSRPRLPFASSAMVDLAPRARPPTAARVPVWVRPDADGARASARSMSPEVHMSTQRIYTRVCVHLCAYPDRYPCKCATILVHTRSHTHAYTWTGRHGFTTAVATRCELMPKFGIFSPCASLCMRLHTSLSICPHTYPYTELTPRRCLPRRLPGRSRRQLCGLCAHRPSPTLVMVLNKSLEAKSVRRSHLQRREIGAWILPFLPRARLLASTRHLAT